MSLELVDHLARAVVPALAVLWFGLKIINISWEVRDIRDRQYEQMGFLRELLRRVPPVESDLYPDEDQEETNE